MRSKVLPQFFPERSILKVSPAEFRRSFDLVAGKGYIDRAAKPVYLCESIRGYDDGFSWQPISGFEH